MAVINHCSATLSCLSPPFFSWLSKANEEKEVRERKLVFANANLLNICRLQDSGSQLCAPESGELLKCVDAQSPLPGICWVWAGNVVSI